MTRQERGPTQLRSMLTFEKPPNRRAPPPGFEPAIFAGSDRAFKTKVRGPISGFPDLLKALTMRS